MTVSVGQAYALVAVVAEPDIKVSQAYTLVAANIPSEEVNVAQSYVHVAVEETRNVVVPSAYVLVAVRGRMADPRVRSWTFTLDNHDNYVVRMGEAETLVYDLLSEQWYIWGSGNTSLWKAYTGANWLGGYHFAHAYGSNIVVGDDFNGSLYFLNPDASTDDHHVDGDATPVPFQRVVSGQVLLKGYNSSPCYAVSLMGSIGKTETVDDETVKLETSDDHGTTYTDRGSITVPEGEYSTRVTWRSLGSIKAPGRLFKITDTGILKRIDAVDMEDGE
jgi:hypothetical protein